MDAGCGFPPVTSADTAQAFSDWHVYGIDYAFDDYVLYDHEGHDTCFDAWKNPVGDIAVRPSAEVNKNW